MSDDRLNFKRSAVASPSDTVNKLVRDKCEQQVKTIGFGVRGLRTGPRTILDCRFESRDVELLAYCYTRVLHCML